MIYGAGDWMILEPLGEDKMPIELPDKGRFTYKNLVVIIKRSMQTYYNIRRILGLECVS